MTQEITLVPVDNRTADWPRKVATVLNRLQRTTMLAGGSATWGSITGTLSAQTDLNSALSGKQATLVSGTNIKTVNGSSLLGSGNLSVGTVTSVAASVPTGFSIGGSPITGSGTLAITFDAGYSLPNNASQANWNTAFGWGNHASAGYALVARTLTAGAGLTGGGDLSADRTFAVGAGTGITVNADDVAIDTTAEAERIRDVIGSALVAGSNVTITVNDAGDTITIAASGGGGSSSPVVPGGRLTLVSATPVLTSDQTAKTSVYYTPYISDLVPLYSGSTWANTTFAELTLSLDTTNHTSGSLYDVFIWSNAGTVSIGTGPAWSSSTARGTGAGTTEIERKNGIWTNKNSITLKNGAGSGTSGVAANTALYVGTIYCTANGQTGFKANPAAAAGGSSPFCAISNAYNRKRITLRCQDSTGAWNYNSTTWRASNNSTSNRATFIDGLGEANIQASFQCYAQAASASGADVGLYLDATSGTPTAAAEWGVSTAGGGFSAVSASWLPQLGQHYVQAAEAAATAASQTFLGFAGSPARQIHNLNVTVEY